MSVACQSVCLSVRARFGHISGTGRPINFVFGVRQRAVRPENVCRAYGRHASARQERRAESMAGTPGYARQARRASAECIMLYVLAVYPAVSWAPRGRAHECALKVRVNLSGSAGHKAVSTEAQEHKHQTQINVRRLPEINKVTEIQL